MKQLYKKIVSLCVFYISYFVALGQAQAVLGDDTGGIRYCQNRDDCGIQQGINKVGRTLDNSVTNKSLSVYIQEVIAYALTFITLIAVVYIIYAGFRILIGNGDEEALKKSKSIIIYVILGLIVMWLAWAITTFIFEVLGA